MKNFILFIFVIVFFSACSATNQPKVDSTPETISGNELTTDTTANKDELMDEFNDEFTQPKQESFDPLEGYNRTMTSFNDYFYLNILEPTAKGYAAVIPENGRVGVSNFFYNLKFPIRFINNLLQFKLMNATEEVGRFVINSTFGLLGLLDPATNRLNMEKHDEDFGQTLGFYGAGEGFHIVLPLLGPSNLRDTIGLVADSYVSPLTETDSHRLKDYKIPDNTKEAVSIAVVNTVNTASLNIGKYENLKKDAIDLYLFLKDTYTQKREKEIRE